VCAHGMKRTSPPISKRTDGSKDFCQGSPEMVEGDGDIPVARAVNARAAAHGWSLDMQIQMGRSIAISLITASRLGRPGSVRLIIISSREVEHG